MEYVCGTCGKRVDRELLVFMDHTQRHIIDEIKRKHPDWSEKDGICMKCLAYFKRELKGDR